MTLGPRDTILRRLGFYRSPAFFDAVKGALHEAADDVRAEAQHKIVAGSVSGKAHVPSPPGQAPHNDTGHLAANIEVTTPAPFVARVTSHASYSAVHEFGSSTHPARPFLRPARDKIAPRAAKRLVQQIRKAKARFK